MTRLKGKLLQKEPMSRHTSFQIGGPADFFFVPEDAEDLKQGLRYAGEKQIPWFVLGNGSDILVSDRGIRGMVIHLSAPSFRKIEFHGNSVTVGAGVKTGTLLHESLDRNFGGIEFLGSIPATLGGVFYMNAGTYLGDIARAVESVTFLDESPEEKTLPKEKLGYAYRQSVFQGKPWVILKGTLRLVPMPREAAQAKLSEILERRRKTQPLKIPSAGSAFKNPPGRSAWKLIGDAGFRGYSVGDAVVSDTHTNFIVNRGNAAASDVLRLMRAVQERVRDKTGILLEPEIRLVGEWDQDFIREF